MGQAAASLTNVIAPTIGSPISFATGAVLPQNWLVSIQTNNTPQFVLLAEGWNGIGWTPIQTFTAPGDYVISAIQNPVRGALTPPVPYTQARLKLLSIAPNVGVQQAEFDGSISGTALTVDAGTVTGTIAIGQALSVFPGYALFMVPGTIITGGSGRSWTVNNSQTMADGSLFATGPISLSAQIAGGP